MESQTDLRLAESEVDRLARLLHRERRARQEAEEIAERTTSALYDRQRELELLGAVATASNEAISLEHALETGISGMCTHLRWPLGHAYVVDQNDGRLKPTGLWYSSQPNRFTEFRLVTANTTFDPGEGLPGRVLSTGRPVWVEDAALGGNFPRQAAVLSCAIRSAFAFPILVGNQTVGVIEVFNDKHTGPDQEVLALAAQVGTQLGRVAERLNAQETLAHAALHDTLTGLPNRTLFLDRLELALARADRRGSLTGVLFVDLDRFKSVNDSSGHHAGDQLLREVGRRLDDGLRREDTVARLGGDEFVVLCEDLRDERQAAELAERLQLLLLQPVQLSGGHEQLVTASIGIAVGAPGQTDPDTLLGDADAAMYRAKDLGRARHELFNEAMRDRVLERLRTERALGRALENDELSLHYQPIVALDGNRIQGVEALVRWDDPERGPRSPGEFIPIAEESDLILRVGEWVLKEACAQAARWRAMRDHRILLPVHVNLAARQLSDERLPDIVRAAVMEAGLNPHDLALEITESALMENSEVPARTLAELRSLGVRVLLDDFGTGYSSLSYLRRFPVDVLKIDRSFVADLGQQDDASAIVGAIVGMGHSLGLTIVAEGIETTAQAAEATRLGCDSGQGYLFARPGPTASLDVLT